MPQAEVVGTALASVVRSLGAFGGFFEPTLVGAATLLVLTCLVPAMSRLRRPVLAAATGLLALGEAVLVWLHVRLYHIAVVVNPETGRTTGRIAVPLWVESEKLYVWALIVAVMALAVRTRREKTLPGLMIAVAVLVTGAALWGRPFSDPLPQFLGQYGGYLSAVASGDPNVAMSAYQGIEGSRQFYYNTWYMWVHPPLLFLSYGAFVVSFVAILLTIRHRHSSYEASAYWWARIGYLPLTAGMLLGFPWAILAWSGSAWWWSGKVNMSIMMWLLYTAYLHARLYLRRRGMWRWVAGLNVLSFAVLVLTYLATYVIPGAHSYA